VLKDNILQKYPKIFLKGKSEMDKCREKLNEYFLSGDSGFINKRQLLSGILSFSDTVDDPEALADSLLKKYLRVENILNLAASGMIMTEGLDRNTTFLLKLILEASTRQMVQAGIGTVLNSPAEVCSFFEDTYKGIREEELRLVCLDSDLRILDYAIIARGDQYAVTFNKDELLRKAKNSGCKLCIIAHNHPGAPSTPSDADFAVTRKLREYLDKLGIILAEHIIIGEDGAKSMFAENMIYNFLDKAKKF
jgi:DNA repair protein RadC